MTVTAVLCLLTAAALAVLAVRHFRGRGFLLNNAWLYASKEERERMDTAPWYRQTAIVFTLLSGVFIVIGLSLILREPRLNLLEIPLLAGAVLYAVVSTARISRAKDETKE